MISSQCDENTLPCMSNLFIFLKEKNEIKRTIVDGGTPKLSATSYNQRRPASSIPRSDSLTMALTRT